MPRQYKPNNKPRKTVAPNQRQLRIIGGQWRGRKLEIMDSQGLRPTPDRVRETLFNWLAADVHEANCLDLFAGTGVLGLEALSRGAEHCQFVESSAAVCSQLRQHCDKLIAGNATLTNSGALQWLDQTTPQAFDIVFIDPPYHTRLAEQCCEKLLNGQWLSNTAVIYLEMAKDEEPPTPLKNWTLHREKTAGQVCYRLYHAPK